MADYNDSDLFGQLIAMLHIGALQQMGLVENPLTKKRNINLPLARITIDTIEMLNRRIKDLTPSELEMLNSMLFDLRMRFVAATQAKGETIEELDDDIDEDDDDIDDDEEVVS
jgi:hypothetical protein